MKRIFSLLFIRTELLKAKGQLNVQEVQINETGVSGIHENDDGETNSLNNLTESDVGKANDVIDEEEADGHRGLGPLRYRSRTRNYSIKGETGDVTDGRIVH